MSSILGACRVTLYHPSRAWLLALVAVSAACAAYEEEPPAPAEEQAAAPPPPLTLRAGHYREYENETQAVVDLGKRLMGLDPQNGDRHTKAGMIDIGTALGFGYTGEDCGAGWNARMANGEFAANADHTRGADSPNCGDRNFNTEVSTTYKFSDWYIDDRLTTVSPHPFTAGEGPEPAQSSGNLKQAVVVDAKTGAVSIKEQNIVQIDSSYNGTSASQTMHASFSNAIALQKAITKRWTNATEVGVSVELGGKIGLPLVAEGSVKITAGVKNNTTVGEDRVEGETTTVTPSCTFDIPVPAGCHYTATLTAHVSRERRRYWADVTMAPRVAALHGFMRQEQNGGCNSRFFREGDGKCRCNDNLGKAGAECKNQRPTFQATFGGAEMGKSFIEDIGHQRATDQGNWFWYGAAGGFPELDRAIKGLREDKGRYQFSLPFEYANDQILSCTLDTVVQPDSNQGCTAPPRQTKKLP